MKNLRASKIWGLW